MVPLEPFKDKVSKPKETRPRQEELAGKANQGKALKETRPQQEELAEKANQGISRNLPRRAARPGKAR